MLALPLTISVASVALSQRRKAAEGAYKTLSRIFASGDSFTWKGHLVAIEDARVLAIEDARVANHKPLTRETSESWASHKGVI